MRTFPDNKRYVDRGKYDNIRFKGYCVCAYFGDCDRLFPLFFKQVVAIFTIQQRE